MANTIQNAVQEQNAQKATAVAPVNAGGIINSLLDSSNMRKRFDALLGARAPQFISSIISICNENKDLQACVRETPMSVITAALKAASYDLPIDPALGFAYIIPSRNTVKTAEGNVKKWQARFQFGWKGLEQLCIRTGAYDRLPRAVDIRKGELIHYDRLTSDIEIKWIDDEDEREKTEIVGYAAYFRLKNGAESALYMSKAQVEAHERKYRIGEYMGKGWRDDWDAMARKTVLGKLIRANGVLSIDYRDANVKKLMDAVAIDEDKPESDSGTEIVTDVPYSEVSENADGGES